MFCMSIPTITECNTPDLIEAVTTLLEEMYTTLSPQELRAGIAEMQKDGWRYIGIFQGKQCKATVAYRIGYRIYCRKFLQLECLYVHPDHRRDGYAAALFDWAEEKAKQEKCQTLILDSYADNVPGHKFFYARGYHIRGFHFNKQIGA